MLIGSVVLTVVASFTVFLRLFAQRIAKGALWYDDYAIIIGWVCSPMFLQRICSDQEIATGTRLHHKRMSWLVCCSVECRIFVEWCDLADKSQNSTMQQADICSL